MQDTEERASAIHTKSVILLGFVTVIFGMAIGFFGFRHYTQTQAQELLANHAMSASVRVHNLLEHETRETKITYREILDKIEFDISEIDRDQVALQTTTTPIDKEHLIGIIEYLRGCQEILRALAIKNKKEMSRIVKLRRADAYIDRMAKDGYTRPRRPGLSIIDSAREDVLEDIQAIKEAEKELAESKSDLARSARKLLQLRLKASKIVPDSALVGTSDLDELAK